MVTTKFIATQIEGGGETIALLREQPGGLFRRASSGIVPVSEWPRAAPEAGQAALALARALDDDGQISEEAEGIVLPPQIVARLDEADAFALGLPPATSITLQLNSGGSLAEGTIKVDTKWVRRGANGFSWPTAARRSSASTPPRPSAPMPFQARERNSLRFGQALALI